MFQVPTIATHGVHDACHSARCALMAGCRCRAWSTTNQPVSQMVCVRDRRRLHGHVCCTPLHARTTWPAGCKAADVTADVTRAVACRNHAAWLELTVLWIRTYFKLSSESARAVPERAVSSTSCPRTASASWRACWRYEGKTALLTTLNCVNSRQHQA